MHRDPEITYIRGNVRVVQSLVAGEVQFGIAGTAGAVSARAAGEEVIIAVGVSGAAICKSCSASRLRRDAGATTSVTFVAIEVRRDNPQFDKSSETSPFEYRDTLDEHSRQLTF